MRSTIWRTYRATLATMMVVVVAAGMVRSSYSLLDLPTIGGGVSGDTYVLNAEFENVLNLPQKAFVKLDGVNVGSVDKIATKGYKAQIRMSILTSIRLPRGTRAQLRQATPLGDVFIALYPPPRPARPS